MSRCVIRFSALVSWAALPLLATLLLVRAGGWLEIPPGDPWGWIVTQSPVTLVMASVHVLAIVLMAWMSIATLAQLVGRAFGMARLAAGVERFTPGSVRLLNKRVLALTVTGALSLPGTAHAVGTSEVAPVIRNTTAPAPTVPASTTSAPEVEAAATSATTEHVVTRGENLWMVAESTLQARGESVDSRPLTSYWKRLVEANTERLVDPRNPDLVFSGQSLRLPD